ncbi:MAG: cytochrome c [Chlamydiae bacterium]|nr:cytochrome c [Chlamydiota bacterium]MBI3276981.1 cytochrome c [Chlamydiota bacterium]
MKKILLFALAGLFVFCFSVQESWAVSQWSRKYGVSCNTCHTAFPRLNYFGDQFAQNGFQMPGTEDGDEVAKHIIGDRLNLNELTDVFGIRIAVSPVEVKTNSRTEGSSKETLFDIGNPNWLQLFTAGTIFKNASIFIETEILEDEIEFNWFELGYHNIAGSSLLNVKAGKISMMEFHALTGRLRGIPNINHQVLSGVKSSNGAGDDSISVAQPVPAVEWYGWSGPFVGALGVSNGAKLRDTNDEKNFFGTLKYFVAQEGDFAGSSVSLWGLIGADTKDLLDELTDAYTGEAQNDFWRGSGAFNIRYLEKWDLQFAYLFGHDDDFNLTKIGDQETDFQGIATILGYMPTPQWYLALQFDWVDSDDVTSLQYTKLSPSIWYFPRDNMRIGLTGRFDLESESNKKHEALVHVRSMF